jgi:hypothetical protein
MFFLKKYRSPAMLLVVVAGLLWSSFVWPGNIYASTEQFYFQPGERLVYKLRWGIISAGYAVLEIKPFEQIDEELAWHFVLSIRTNEFVDLFYKVRDRIESYTDHALANSILYRNEQREGSTDRDVVVIFDQDKRTAVYSNKGKAQAGIEIKSGTIDPLSAIFYVRNHGLAENMVIYKAVSDGKKTVEGLVRVIRRETLTIQGVEYHTFLVEPDMKDVSGVFEKSEKSKLKLWITDDERRLLVKIESKVAVGSFIGELVN